MLADISETGLAIAITAIGGAVFGLYALLRKTKREQDTADADANRKRIEADTEAIRIRYERFEAKLTAQMDDLYTKYRALDKEHIDCREEHAQARGELAAMRRDLAAKELRIEELERLLGK